MPSTAQQMLIPIIEEMPTTPKILRQPRVAVYSLQRVRESNGSYDVQRKIRQPIDLLGYAENVLQMQNLAQEHFVILSCDTKNNIIAINTVFIGSLNASIVHPREVFGALVLNSAAAFFCIHNHPSGDPTPSKEDIEMTKRLVECGKIMGIELLDHFIVGDDGNGRLQYKSLREQGII